MKILSVTHNNRRKGFEVTTAERTWWFPYAKLVLVPGQGEQVDAVWVDEELASTWFTYRLTSGAEDSVPLDAVLYYNRDPDYMRDLLLHNLTCQALERVESSGLSRRELIRRLGTSPAQLYRLLDTTNYRKSVDQMVRLLDVLGCDVEFVVKDRKMKPKKPA